MTQLIKFLPDKHENLTSDPQNPWESLQSQWGREKGREGGEVRDLLDSQEIEAPV